MTSDSDTPSTHEGIDRELRARAEDVFVEHVVANGELGDIEPLCAAHPSLEVPLRKLAAAFSTGTAQIELVSRCGPLFAPDLPEHIGGYPVVRLVDRGGMGVIYEVRDLALKRSLALKTVDEAPSPGRRARRQERLRTEARVLASLVHPGVVPLHEVGEDKGRIFFTMQLVDGVHLGEILARAGSDPDWPLTRLIGVLQRVCDTVAHAHSRDIVHRDLKPSNVMVGAFGVTYVMDWGLAKQLTAPAASHRTEEGSADLAPSDVSASLVELTLAGEVVGTPAYMAPEQAFGASESVGPSVDVYSAGTILYHMLAGHPAYAQSSPTTPREIVSRVRSGPPEPLSETAPKAPRELVAIAEKAMHRDPTKRYPDMVSMAHDLRAWLEGRVVGAHGTGSLVAVRKWVRRNPWLSAAILLALASLLLAAVLQHRSERALSLRAEQLRQEVYGNDVALAVHAVGEKDVVGAQDYLRRCPEDLRDWEWRVAARRADNRTDVFDTGGLFDVGSVSPDGRFLVGRSVTSGRGLVWDLPNRTLLCELSEPVLHDPTAHAFDLAKGEFYAGTREGILRVYSLESGALLRKARVSQASFPWINDLALSPNRTRLAVSTHDGGLALYDPTTLELVRKLGQRVGPGTEVLWSPDGKRLYWAGGDTWDFESRASAVRVYDADSAALVTALDGHPSWVGALALSPDGTLLASGGAGEVLVWNLETLELAASYQRGAAIGAHLTWNRDGTLLLVTARSGPTELLETGGWSLRGYLSGSVGRPSRPTRLDDGRFVLPDTDGTVSWWSLDDRSWQTSAPSGVTAPTPVLRPGTTEFAVVGWSGMLELWDRRERQLTRATRIELRDAKAAYTSDGQELLLWIKGGALTIRDADSLEVSGELETEASGEIVTHPNLPLCAVSVHGPAVELWDVAERELRWSVRTGPEAWPFHATSAFSPDGSRLLVAGTDRKLRIVEVATGQLLKELAIETEATQLRHPVWAADGRTAVLGCWDGDHGELLRLDLASGRVLWHARGRDRYQYQSSAFTPDGSRVVANDVRGRLAVFDAESGEKLLALPGGMATGPALAMASDGTAILATPGSEGSGGGMLHFFEGGGLSREPRWGQRDPDSPDDDPSGVEARLAR